MDSVYACVYSYSVLSHSVLGNLGWSQKFNVCELLWLNFVWLDTHSVSLSDSWEAEAHSADLVRR